MSAFGIDAFSPTFLVEAVQMAERGVPVTFFAAGSKANTTQNWQNLATTDVERIIQRAGNADKLNYSCVAKAVAGGCLFLDDDAGIREQYEQTNGSLNPTLKVRSCNGSFHYYFRHSVASLAYQQKIGKAYIGESKPDGKGELWSLRMNDSYVVGPGSTALNHQGEESSWVVADESKIIEIPDSLLEFLINRYGAGTKLQSTDDNGPIQDGHRNNKLTSIAGKLRYEGLDVEDIKAALSRINQKRCHPPLSEQDIDTIARSVSRYQTGENDIPTIGGVPAGTGIHTVTVEDEDEISVQPDRLPEFPRLSGSLDEFTRVLCPDIPYEFKIMAAVAHFGLCRSGLDYLENEAHLQPRFYVCFVKQSGWGKTAGPNEVRTHLKDITTGYSITKSVDSGPALVDEFSDRAKAQSPMAQDKTARLLLDPDEMIDLFEKAKVSKQSKNTLLTELLTLFESNRTGNRSRKSGKTEIDNAHLAVLGGATPEGYAGMWAGTSGNSNGLQNRFVIITTDAPRMPVTKTPTDFIRLIECTSRIQKQSQMPAQHIRFDDESRTMLEDWWSSSLRDKPSEVRVSDMVKRLLIVLAVTNDTTIINKDLMQQAIQFGDYLIAVREKFNPADSYSWTQGFENDIEKVCSRHDLPMTLNEIRRLVQPNRKPGGIGPFLQATKNLLAAGLLKPAGTTAKGTGKYVYEK